MSLTETDFEHLVSPLHDSALSPFSTDRTAGRCVWTWHGVAAQAHTGQHDAATLGICHEKTQQTSP